MCLAIPGKVVEVNGQDVKVEYPGGKKDVKNLGLDISEGDYVIVQAKMIVQKVPKGEALDALKAWEEKL